MENQSNRNVLTYRRLRVTIMESSQLSHLAAPLRQSIECAHTKVNTKKIIVNIFLHFVVALLFFAHVSNFVYSIKYQCLLFNVFYFLFSFIPSIIHRRLAFYVSLALAIASPSWFLCEHIQEQQRQQRQQRFIF